MFVDALAELNAGFLIRAWHGFVAFMGVVTPELY
jgi:hypothetical protein